MPPGIYDSYLFGLLLLVLLCRNKAEESCNYPSDNTKWQNAQCISCRQKWTQLIQTLKHGDQEAFKTAIWPFANATKNSYTWRLSDPVDGWTLIRERDPISGMHALAYQSNEDKSLVLIAIRGTQLGGTPIEEQNDLCADWWLANRDQPAYDFCDRFTVAQMNYFQQLLDFLKEVDQVALPAKACKIHTGHSLGALLGSLASAYSNAEEPAITFAPPGQYTAAKWLDLPLGSSFRSIYSYYSQYDPITVLPESWGNQTGTLCELEEKFEPKSCEICYANPHFDITNLTSPCGLCFNQMHIYGHYLDLIFTENAPHTCTTTRRSATSGARSLLLRPQQWPVPPETFYMFLSITLTITLTMFLLNCGPITLTSRDRRGRQPID